MANSYAEYYQNQAGNGLTAYEGYQYQRGHGFFGSILPTIYNNIIKPLGRYFGKQALDTGVRLGSDVLKGENFKDSLKKNLKVTGEQVLDDGYARAKKFAQTGKGRKRRRRRKSKKTIAKPKKIKKKPSKKKKSVSRRKPKKKRSKRKKSKKFNFGPKFDNLFK